MFLQGKAKAKQALVADEEDDAHASVRKTPFFACLFNTEVDHFAKTDSGQTHI